MSYLSDFLFDPARANSPIKSLSGGERNRLLLARLFARPANVLVLDEPTNDLDIDTLEHLEGLLADYAGTVFLVSHDRSFLDNVVTSVMAFEGEGKWREYEGGYEDWKIQSARSVGITSASPVAKQPATPVSAPAPKAAKKKLSYKDQRELDGLPERISALEAEQKTLSARMQDSAFYAQSADAQQAAQARSTAIEEELMNCLERWELLSA
jgi:ABC transport system ATP-binding/permease protein